MRRRDVIVLLANTTAAWSLAARAQQPAMPVVGFLSLGSRQGDAIRLAGFRQGLHETGYVEGRNVAIEYRWAEGDNDRLRALAMDLVGRQPAVIAAAGAVESPIAAKAATTTIPIVFATGGDPVQMGLVNSLKRPGGNVTGVTSQSVELGPKRLELIHMLVPRASIVAALVNPANPKIADAEVRNLQAAARSLGLTIHVLPASSDGELDGAFAALAELRVGAMVIGNDALFNSRIEQLAALTLRHAVPTIYQFREFALAGGLMSYGDNFLDQYRRFGVYVGRILKGESPAELPVWQSSKLGLIVNLKTARTLGLEVPTSLLASADEVIE